MVRRRRPLFMIIAAAAAAAITVSTAGGQTGAAASGGHHPSHPAKPTKVVIIVVDSLSKEIVDKYGMKNVKKLMKDGVDTPRGYLGHTGSVTVVTHNVITSGQLPKHMGWTDEGYRDVAGILGDPEPTNPDQLYITSNFGAPQTVRAAAGGGLPQARRLPRGRGPHGQDVHHQPEGVRRVGVRWRRLDSNITFSSGTCTNAAGSWRKPSGTTTRLRRRTSSAASAAGSGCTAATRRTRR